MTLVEKRGQEMNILNNKEKEKWIKDSMERETTVTKKCIEDSERAIMLEQEDRRSAESGRLTSRELG
jgi:hypothetical protein